MKKRLDELHLIRVLDRLDKASAIDIYPTIILMHPDVFIEWVKRKHPEFYPAKDELKYGRFKIKITPLVETWGIIAEPHDIQI